jgi:effector-associated domain 1 (EAD1)-containing protein
VSELDGATRRALIDVFRRRLATCEQPRMFLDLDLDRHLDDYAPPGALDQVVYVVINGASREGWLDDLLRVAAREWPEVIEVIGAAAVPAAPPGVPRLNRPGASGDL